MTNLSSDEGLAKQPGGSIELVVLWNERPVLESAFLTSRGLEHVKVFLIDNGESRIPSLERVNEHKRTSSADWLIVCRQETVFLDDLWPARIRLLEPSACYGPIGIDINARLKGLVRQSDGSPLGEGGDQDEVEAIDETCLVIPRAVYTQVNFDDRFASHFYSHDYCRQARARGFSARTVQIDVQDKSGGFHDATGPESYFRAKQEFVDKYCDVVPLITMSFQLVPKYWAAIEASTTLQAELRLVPAASRVLEIGACAGFMTRALIGKQCRVTAVELEAYAARGLAGLCDRVIVGDIESPSTLAPLDGQQFDVIMLGDVIEHLRSPRPVLERLATLLAPNGSLVISLPNVAHGSVRLHLLEGRFDYRAIGLLDQTHLQLYTAATIAKVFSESGYQISDVHRTRFGFFETEIPSDPLNPPLSVLRSLCSDPESTTYQFVFRAQLASSGTESSTNLPADPDWSEEMTLRSLADFFMKGGREMIVGAQRNDRRASQWFARAFGLSRQPRALMLALAARFLPYRIISLSRRLAVSVTTSGNHSGVATASER